jgi:hypothetical protein
LASTCFCSTPSGKRINVTWRCCGNSPTAPRRAHTQSRLVVGAWLLVVFAVMAGLALLAYGLLQWLWLALQ